MYGKCKSCSKSPQYKEGSETVNGPGAENLSTFLSGIQNVICNVHSIFNYNNKKIFEEASGKEFYKH